MMGYKKGRKFSLATNGNKIIGFHGYAEKSLNSLGAYFTTATPNKLECQGDQPHGEYFWDDGCIYDGITKVYVDVGDYEIGCIRCEYDNGGKVEKTQYRRVVENEEEVIIL